MMATTLVGIFLTVLAGLWSSGAFKPRIKDGTPVVLENVERMPLRAGPEHPAAVDVVKKPEKDFSNSIGMKFKWIDPGTNTMGSPESEQGRLAYKAPHKVRLTKGYYLGAHLVTQAQWEAVLGREANQSRFKGSEEQLKQQLPVDSVSWNDCQEFCRKLSTMEKRKYRLPSEAEWEYACRAGSQTPFWCGETITTDQANYNGNYIDNAGIKSSYRERTTPIDTFKANPWGLHDMHGNLWQWCEDYYAAYRVEDTDDPIRLNKEDSSSRVLRGGSWFNDSLFCRSAHRFRAESTSRYDYFGCRVVYIPE